nr:hypothetical protein [Tanacetum cinerariifolium]
MLDRTDFASWQQRIRLYCRGKENRVNILKSIDEGPYKMGTVRETLTESTEGTPQFGPERPRVYSDLSSKEKDRYNADIRATNILLQGLPKDIYTLINHYTDAKDIWDNVKMLLEGSELTKEDRESQLYDDFKHFRQHKEESIHDYYVRFAKLINDMRNIKMTMSRMQLNSKFVNNMRPEWGRFVTAVKLNRGLRDSNYDQLLAYLKQHETHAKENKMMLERFSQPTVDPLALLSNVSNPHHYSPSSSASSSTQVPTPLVNSSSPAEDLIENLTNTLALLTQSYRTFLPQTNNQLRTSINARNQATVQDSRVVVQNVQGRPNRGQGMNPWGGSAAGYKEAQNRVGTVNQGQARPGQARTVKCYNCNGHIARNYTQPKRPQNSEYFKDKMLLMQAQENRVALDAKQLLFLAGGQDNAFDDDAEDCDAFDSDVDEAPTAQTMFMANLSSADPITDEDRPSYDSYVKDNEVPVVHSDASFVPNDAFMMIYNDMEQVELYERRAKFELTEREQKINEQLRLVISDRNFKEETLKRELHSIKLQLASTINRNKSMSALYNGHEILKDNHAPAKVHNTEDTLEIAEIIRKKMNDKMTDPECVTRKLKSEALKEQTKVSRPIKSFTMYPPNTPANLVPKVLPTKSQVKIHIFTLIQLFLDFDKTCKKRITPTWLTKGERGFERTKECYLKEIIPFFKTLKDNFEGIQKALTKEIKEMKDVFKELEAEVAQFVVDRKHDAIDRKNLPVANDNLIAECLSQEVFSVATNSELNVARFTEMHVANTSVEARCLALEAELANLHKDTLDFDSVFVIGKMQASLQGKDNAIRQLKKRLSQLQETRSDTDRTSKVRTTDSQITKLTDHVTNLQAQNDLSRAENEKIKQHYKELYDSIKITRAKHIEQVTKLTTENVTLKTSVSKDKVKPQVLTRAKHVIDVEPIVLRLRNNRDAHLDYLRHLKESVETIRDIVEEAKVVRPLDRSIVSACRYTEYSQELLEYAIGTCRQSSQQRAKQLAHIPLIRKKQVTAATPSDKQDSNTHIHVVTVKPQKTNVPVPPFTGVKSCPKASGSQPKSNPKTNRISPTKGVNKLPVKDQPRTNKSHPRTTNRVDSSSRLKRTVINSNSDSIYQTCNKCLTSFDHDICVATYLKSAVAPFFIRHNCKVVRKVKQVWKTKQVRQLWKPT